MAKAKKAARPAREPTRFAFPFFTATPPERRTPVNGARRMTELIQQQMGPIPPVQGKSVMDLADIIGKKGRDEIQAAGAIRFHATGDTGKPSGGTDDQEEVAAAMTSDFRPEAGDGKNPAFFLHLGDVIYGQRKQAQYRDEFYRPYMKYPGKILAIPGNHDGETFKDTDPKPLAAFIETFCAPKAVVPKIASDVRIFRETMTQPGVYWLLQAPFLNLIGLYSNTAEGPGDLRGANGDDKQIKWLRSALADIKKAGENKALVIATHHPPFSEGGHSGSTAMLRQIDDACIAAGILPHAMLAGHTHTYQRYMRTVKKPSEAKIIYIDAGCGGHAASAVKQANGQKIDDAIFVKSLKGFGYLMVAADKTKLEIDMIQTTGGSKQSFDKVTIGIASHQPV